MVSGLVKFIPEARMLGARCLVLANVKPGKLRDEMSEGMVLCASDAEHTQARFILLFFALSLFLLFWEEQECEVGEMRTGGGRGNDARPAEGAHPGASALAVPGISRGLSSAAALSLSRGRV